MKRFTGIFLFNYPLPLWGFSRTMKQQPPSSSNHGKGKQVVSFPPSFARTFSSKERRLGTRQMKQIIKNQLGGRKQDGYFTSVVVDLNSGLPRINPTSGQGGTLLIVKDCTNYKSSALTAQPLCLRPFQELL